MLNALKEDALGQVLDRVSEGFGGVLGQEEAAESFVQARLKAVNVLIADLVLVTALLALIGGRFEQVPKSGNQEVFSLL